MSDDKTKPWELSGTGFNVSQSYKITWNAGVMACDERFRITEKSPCTRCLSKANETLSLGADQRVFCVPCVREALVWLGVMTP